MLRGLLPTFPIPRPSQLVSIKEKPLQASGRVGLGGGWGVVVESVPILSCWRI